MAQLTPLRAISEPPGNVIFLHGLGGDHLKTWGFDRHDSWLNWLSGDFPEIAIWSFNYDASPTRWKQGDAMPLTGRARNLLNFIISERLVGPIFLIGHSMGGLLAKQLFQTGYSNIHKYGDIIDQIKGIVFIATPHQGSRLADFFSKWKLFTKSTVAIEELRAHNSQLKELGTWFRNQYSSLDIEILSFCETQKTKKVKISKLVVDADSADIGIPHHEPIEVDADHIEIAKPKTPKETIVYGRTSVFLERLLNKSTNRKASLPQNNIVASTDLLDSLKKLPPVLFDLLVFRLDVSRAIAGQQASQLKRSMDIIELMSSRPDGLEVLAQLLKEITPGYA